MAFEGSDNSALTISSANAFYKRFYIQNRKIDALIYGADKFFSRFKRQPATQIVEGETIVVPVLIGRSPSASEDFTEAQDQAKSRTGPRGVWHLPIDEEYGVIRVSDKAILASKTDRGAFFRMLKQETDLAIKGVKNRLCTSLFADTPNSAGTVASKSGSTFTLSLLHQLTAFDINDRIEFRSPTGVLRAGGYYYIDKVNRASRVITVHKAVHATVVANDVVYRVGDYSRTAKTSLLQYIPKTAPTSTLNNINRSIDPIRLGGSRINMTQTDRFDDIIRTLASRIYMFTGENPTIALMSPLVENLVAIEQRAQIRFDDASGKGAARMIGAGVGGLSIKTANGEIEIVPSAFFPVDTILLLNESDLAFFYMSDRGDDAVFFKKMEGGGYFKISHDAPGIEARIESFGNYLVQNPGLHGRITLHSSKVPSIS